jgi:pimeloyl-ACP methyl ester carboxylesterase
MIDRGTGTPVVLMPGIQGRWEWLTPAIDALAQQCRVITFSLCDEPSSGFSHDPAMGIENYFAQLDQAFDRAGLQQAVLIGISYSGPIAAEFAARRPDRVRALVLVSALPTDWRPNARAQFYLRAPRLLSPVFAVDSPTRMLPELRAALPGFGAVARFATAQTARVLRAFMSPSRMATRLRWMDDFHYSDVSTLAQPVLVITGEDGLDRVVDPALTRRYLAALPSARHVVLPKTGHIGMLTRPVEFAEIVRRFADEGSQDGRRISA